VRIVPSSGDRHDVRHPDLIMIGQRDVTIGIATHDDPEFYDRQSYISLLHIASIEDLPAETPRRSSNGNGSGHAT
jgi:hypothetical protein